jgi:uncharacterized protein YheU (UPF0270 family)
MSGISIPPDQLTTEALLGVIDAFILREGTDYGHQEFTLDEKRSRVRAMLQRGEAAICYYPENEHIDIVLAG